MMPPDAHGPRLGIIEAAAFQAIAHELVRHDAVTIVLARDSLQSSEK